VVEVLAQLSQSALPGSEHGIFITVDYGMDGDDYINNVTLIAAAAATPVSFNAVS